MLCGETITGARGSYTICAGYPYFYEVVVPFSKRLLLFAIGLLFADLAVVLAMVIAMRYNIIPYQEPPWWLVAVLPFAAALFFMAALFFFME